MSKQTHITIRSNQGQLSLFIAVIVMVIVTIMAFIVNVGLFVKAKINLQNAVDAAAWSGAAVQARQLSNIAYVNWEMRNVFKEWMFKYWVLGEMALTNAATMRTPMDWRMRLIGTLTSATNLGDRYNIPATCLHYGNTNICDLYTVPGLPRLSPLGLVGLDDTITELTNTLVDQKAKDCAERGDLNNLMAMRWAFGAPLQAEINNPTVSTLWGSAPKVAVNRAGAWPKAIELAFRVRNLELIMNDPPKSKLCTGGASNCTNIATLYQTGASPYPIAERSVKAFWAAWRNLENNDPLQNLKHTFTLTELAPNPKRFQSGGNSLSTYPIPTTSGNATITKYYLDLYLQALNYGVFYTLFTARSDVANTSSLAMEAACSATKVALPVPGYPLGFVKNPGMLTYYAVKGSARYTGLFNPFRGNEGTEMVAYAAAKPFGGRVGPLLFKIGSDATAIEPRINPTKSFPYLVGMNWGAAFSIGMPIPFDAGFWISSGSTGTSVGGVPQAGSLIRYGMPNLIYDFVADMTPQNSSTGNPLHITAPTANGTSALSDAGGLYDGIGQYAAFRRNIDPLQPLTAANVEFAIRKARGPTLYDAANYLLPTLHTAGIPNSSDSPSTVSLVQPTGADDIANYKEGALTLFAPLWGPGTYFDSVTSLQGAVDVYIGTIRDSLMVYLKGLKKVSKEIVAQSPVNNGVSLYLESAKRIYSDSDSGYTSGNATNIAENAISGAISCTSLAGKFAAFFSIGNCTGINPVGLMLKNYWSEQDNGTAFHTHLQGDYVASEAIAASSLMTAYGPGREYGNTGSNIIAPPLSAAGSDSGFSRNVLRNYYSTKFVAVTSLVSPSGSYYNPYVESGNFAVFSESLNTTPEDIKQNNALTFLNPISQLNLGLPSSGKFHPLLE